MEKEFDDLDRENTEENADRVNQEQEESSNIYRMNKDEIPKDDTASFSNADNTDQRQQNINGQGGPEMNGGYYQGGQGMNGGYYQGGPGMNGGYYQGGPGMNGGYYQNGPGMSQGGNPYWYQQGMQGEIPPKKKKRKPVDYKKWAKKAGILIASAALFGVVAGVGFQGISRIINKINPPEAKTEAGISPGKTGGELATTTQSSVETRPLSDVSEMTANVEPSIVAITSIATESVNDWFGTYNKDVKGSGSGIIVGKNSKELLIVTNNHVVEGAKTIKVTFNDDKTVTATVKGTDSSNDLAVVSVKLSDIKNSTMGKIKIATLGDSDNVKVGQMAVAIGNALGYGQSVTVGYISAKDRQVTIGTNTMTLLQTDAAINPGNSGGALLNMNGEVIGINSVKYADSKVEGMGYAIPISTAKPIIDELMKKEKISEEEKGYIGITGRTVEEAVASAYNLPLGVFVAKTEKNGPAASAGIVQGDIITKINNVEVKSIDSLKEKVSGYKAGTKISVTYKRKNGNQYEEKTVTVVLAKQPENAASSNPSQDNSTQDESGQNGGIYDLPGGFDFGY